MVTLSLTHPPVNHFLSLLTIKGKEREIQHKFNVKELIMTTQCDTYACECADCTNKKTEYARFREKNKTSGQGKWNDKDTPKRGWVCTGLVDHMEKEFECEMCEFQTCRYVQTMHHPGRNMYLDVGCVCAD